MKSGCSVELDFSAVPVELPRSENVSVSPYTLKTAIATK